MTSPSQREALEQAKIKLQLYRAEHCGLYVGGMEYSQLIKYIDAALATPTPSAARTPPDEMEACHNTGEREPSVMPAYPSGGTELRVKARLAWNGWPDTVESRRVIAEHEARDKLSSDAWDRVIFALLPDEAAIRAAAFEEAAKIVENLRIAGATNFKDARHSGQRGADYCDALYDAYHAIRAAGENSK